MFYLLPRVVGILLVLPLISLSAGLSAQSESNSSQTCYVSTATTASLSSARTLFADVCSNYTLRDCDPMHGGGWSCSSGIIGGNAPGLVNPSVAENTSVNQPPASIPAQARTQEEPACSVQTDGDLQSAKAMFVDACAGYVRLDCDPKTGGGWICSSGVIGLAAPTLPRLIAADRAETPTPTAVAITPDSQPASTPIDILIVGSSVAQTSIPDARPNPTVGLFNSGDLVSLHYDNCPDRDDGHALAAGKAVLYNTGISAPLVVNGTCGNSVRNRYQASSLLVVRANWGDNFLDAANHRDAAVRQAAERWAGVLANDHHIWVAEGGPSDYTADVLQLIERQYSNLDLKRVHVLQHANWNQDHTSAANLNYVRSQADYRFIPNGNIGNNGSADLNQQSNYFVGTARSSAFASEWNAAFDYLQPDCSTRTEHCKLDFSDTVELLYIVGDSTTSNVNDFANRYLK